MHLVDHIFILILFVVQPIYGARSYRRYLERLANGAPPDRVGLYKQTLVIEWVAFFVVGAAWILLDRPFALLGFVKSSSMQVVGGALALALITAFLIYSWQSARKMKPEKKAETARSLGKLVHFLPHTTREYRHFVGISITAGIVEETLYRGFAFWYLAHYMPIWSVILLSSIIFGLGHTYQGVGGVARVSLVGVAFGVLYVLTGSIWLPMLMHIILDAVQGAGILEVLRRSDAEDAGETLYQSSR